jgi:hypothetical protein
VRIEPERIDFGRFPARTDGSGPGEILVRDIFVDAFRKADETGFPQIGDFQAPSGVTIEEAGASAEEEYAPGLIRRRRRYTATLRPDVSQAGSFVETLRVPLHAGGEATAFVIWSAVAPLVASPARFHFGSVEPGGSRTQHVLVQAAENRPFRVLDVTGEPWSVTLDGDGPPAEPKRFHSLTVRLTIPDDPPARVANGVVVIHTDMPDYPIMRLPWSVFVRTVRRGCQFQ